MPKFLWRSLLPRTIRGWLGLFAIIVLTFVAFGALLLYSTPHWYAPLDPTDPHVIDTAEVAQNKVLDLHNKLEQLRQGEREWSITQDEINSFLTVNAHQNDGPSGSQAGSVADPMVILRPGQITIAARISGVPGSGPSGGVVTVVTDVAALPPDQDGQTPMQITLKSVTLGSLPVPQSLVRQEIPKLAAAIGAALSKSVDPEIIGRLLNGQAVPLPIYYRKRLVHIKDLQITNGKLTVVLTLQLIWIDMDKREISAILNSAGLRPQHRLGQNFMIDQVTLARIADAGDVGPQDVVLEIGPGVGNLTRRLATQGVAVLAVDIDARLLAAARQHHREQENIIWMEADALAGKHEVSGEVVEALRALHRKHPDGKIKLVSNLPYNVASPLIAELLVLMWQERTRPDGLFFERMTFTVQWEVAQRMVAKTGTRDYGPLGILIGLMADVEIMRKIPPGAFWPPPKVNSALVKVLPQPQKFNTVKDILALQKLLTGVFAHRRQRIRNALDHWLKDSQPEKLIERAQAAGIDTTARPEELAPEQFVRLAEICAP